MSASPAESTQDPCVKTAFRYLMVTILCAVFGAVYELFSHGVYANGMLYAFLFPLVGGVMPALLIARRGCSLPSEAAQQVWHFGISALTVGSLFSGALEIYGTSSPLTRVYWLAGGACLMLAVLTAVFMPKRTSENAVDMGM